MFWSKLDSNEAHDTKWISQAHLLGSNGKWLPNNHNRFSPNHLSIQPGTRVSGSFDGRIFRLNFFPMVGEGCCWGYASRFMFNIKRVCLNINHYFPLVKWLRFLEVKNVHTFSKVVFRCTIFWLDILAIHWENGSPDW